MSSKERLILEAVNSLADEGKQLYDITVSEIAARAGVGKGTVYEYFVTKDEIISKAVAYKILSEGLETEKRIRAEKTLQEKFFTAIDCVYNNARECMITCMITISALTARLEPGCGLAIYAGESGGVQKAAGQDSRRYDTGCCRRGAGFRPHCLWQNGGDLGADWGVSGNFIRYAGYYAEQGDGIPDSGECMEGIP